MLSSKLLSPNPRLNDCEVLDAAHVKLGDRGDFVTRIQQALATIGSLAIAEAETSAGLYGQTTAAAVLAYKTRRGIINHAYQFRPDDIVGKMTIKHLDDDMLAIEARGASEFFGAELRNARGHLY